MERLSVFKCAKCGNIVEVMYVGGGILVCCGEPMKEMKANVTDGATEKHVPVFDGNKVKVGSAAHPMQEDHYIEWIEVINQSDDRHGGERVCRKFLKPGEAPEAEFGDVKAGTVAREYCNKHGLWKAEA